MVFYSGTLKKLDITAIGMTSMYLMLGILSVSHFPALRTLHLHLPALPINRLGVNPLPAPDVDVIYAYTDQAFSEHYTTVTSIRVSIDDTGSSVGVYDMWNYLETSPFLKIAKSRSLLVLVFDGAEHTSDNT
jgi:hypothetical protein